MIDIAVPQDIREFEPTLVGVFTTRQTVCGLGALLAGFGVYKLEEMAGLDPMSAPLFLIAALPFILVGWVKMYGLHFEKFIIKAVWDNLLCAANRKYCVDNFFRRLQEESRYEGLTEAEKRELKKEEAAARRKRKPPARGGLPQELRPYRERHASKHRKVYA